MRLLRHWIAKSWVLSQCHYHLYGVSLSGSRQDTVWYFAYGANMHDSAFRERRKMRPFGWRVGRIYGYRLRFNLEGRPKGKAAPANLVSDSESEVWGVLYAITKQDLLLLDASEGVPGRRYRHLWLDVEDAEGRAIHAVTYVADGKETDGNPSLRYITLLREGAKAHGLPDHYLQMLNKVVHTLS